MHTQIIENSDMIADGTTGNMTHIASTPRDTSVGMDEIANTLEIGRNLVHQVINQKIVREAVTTDEEDRTSTQGVETSERLTSPRRILDRDPLDDREPVPRTSFMHLVDSVTNFCR